MPDDITRDTVEREQTDASLRTERAQTDRALAARQKAVEAAADKVIEVARENADAILDAAREKADDRLAAAGQPGAARAAIIEERVDEDAALQEERQTADESLRREREETAQTLRSLIPFEREKTDRHLLTERALWDDAVTNRDDFLGIVSHDLRGLLSGIVMSAALLGAKASTDVGGTHALAQSERIQRYAARMNRLIGDLVDVASIEAGKLSVTLAEADAAALLSEAVDTLQVNASAKNIVVAIHVDQRPMLSVFDYPRMLQVMTNLISNALKFTPEGGRVTVHGERIGNGVRLSVKDTGSGIPEHQLEAIFERFWQLDATDRRGLGLGLFISRSIVDAHHGRIWAESREGSGTTIHLTLHATEETQKNTEVRRTEQIGEHPEKKSEEAAEKAHGAP